MLMALRIQGLGVGPVATCHLMWTCISGLELRFDRRVVDRSSLLVPVSRQLPCRGGCSRQVMGLVSFWSYYLFMKLESVLPLSGKR